MSAEPRRIRLPNGDVGTITDGYADDLAWFESALVEHGVRLNPTSALARGIAALRWFIGATEKREHQDSPEFVRRIFATGYLVRAARRAGNTPSWPAIARAWLPDLRRGDVGLVGFEPGDLNASRDRAFEFLMATLAAHVCKNVQHAEPDVVGEYPRKKSRFGLSCKILYSERLSQQVNEIVKGVKQLEASECSSGVVMANVTALLDHEKLMPTPTETNEHGQPIYRGMTIAEARATILRQLQAISQRFLESGELRSRVVGDRNNGARREKTRGLFLFAQTVIPVRLDAAVTRVLEVPHYTVAFGVPTAVVPLHVRYSLAMDRDVRRFHRDVEDLANRISRGG